MRSRYSVTTARAGNGVRSNPRQRWEDLSNARFDLLLYDLTSTYFECNPFLVTISRCGTSDRAEKNALTACRSFWRNDAASRVTVTNGTQRFFGEKKNKLEEKKSWASSITAKAIQMEFICLAHNLMLLLEAKLETEGIHSKAEDKHLTWFSRGISHKGHGGHRARKEKSKLKCLSGPSDVTLLSSMPRSLARFYFPE